MIKLVFATLLSFGSFAFASGLEVKLACKAAIAGMPRGSGATVYYRNGNTLTTNAGRAGATWYYVNGNTLTTSMSMPGATFYYSNGNTLSTSFGKKGATWYYSNGNTITTTAPALTPEEMAQAACDLIVGD